MATLDQINLVQQLLNTVDSIKQTLDYTGEFSYFDAFCASKILKTLLEDTTNASALEEYSVTVQAEHENAEAPDIQPFKINRVFKSRYHDGNMNIMFSIRCNNAQALDSLISYFNANSNVTLLVGSSGVSAQFNGNDKYRIKVHKVMQDDNNQAYVYASLIECDLRPKIRVSIPSLKKVFSVRLIKSDQTSPYTPTLYIHDDIKQMHYMMELCLASERAHHRHIDTSVTAVSSFNIFDPQGCVTITAPCQLFEIEQDNPLQHVPEHLRANLPSVTQYTLHFSPIREQNEVGIYETFHKIDKSNYIKIPLADNLRPTNTGFLMNVEVYPRVRGWDDTIFENWYKASYINPMKPLSIPAFINQSADAGS